MKKLNVQTTRPSQGKKNLRKKIAAGIGLSLLFSSGLMAQTSSYSANIVPITGAYNSGFGVNALILNTTGTYNTALGVNTLRNNTSGIYNTAGGVNSLFYNTTGQSNTAFGISALATAVTANDNTAIGAFTLRFNTTGAQCTALGSSALTNNTTANNNTALGYFSMSQNTTGGNNTATGYNSLYSNTNGTSNTANGYGALYTNSTGYNNSAFGFNSLPVNTSGAQNTGIGLYSLYKSTTGNNNSCLGFESLYSNITGSNNTGLGTLADVSTSTLSNATAVGYAAVVNNSNRVWLGNLSVDVWTANSYNISDQRFKSSVNADDVKGLEFIKLLRPVVYNLETRKITEFMTKNMPDSIRQKHLDLDFSKSTALRQSGFLAQEVEDAAKKVNYSFSGVHHPENDNDTYGVSYEQFVVPLVKAVQEQQKMIEDQKQQLDQQKQQIADLQNKANATGTSTGIEQLNSATLGFSMGQNVPNPFTSETIVKYTIPQQVSSAYMAVYDLSGKQVASFPITQKGSASITLTAEKLSAGIYIYSIIADGKVLDSKKMIVAAQQN